MITIQQLAAHCVQSLKAPRRPGVRFEKTSDFVDGSDLAESLKGAQFFDISDGICEVAISTRTEFVDEGVLSFPATCRLPARLTVLRLRTAGLEESLIFLSDDEAGDSYKVSAAIWSFGGVRASMIGGVMPSTGKLGLTTAWDRDPANVAAANDILVLCCVVLTLINEPNLVSKVKGGDRAGRRFNQRGFGLAVDSWHSCQWEIGATVRAKIARDPSFHKVPLHYRRGHFRRAEPHFAGAVHLPESTVNSRPAGWFQHIPGQWVGHIAFGIKRHVYSPRLPAFASRGRDNADQG